MTRVVDLTTDKIEAFIQAQLEAGAKPATVNRRTGALRQALHLATKARKLSRARVPFVPMLTEDNARSGFVEPATFELIAAHLPDPVADIARFAYHSACRRGEVVPLRWDSVDRTNREARLRTSKNKRPRTLPLAGVLWEVIERRWQAREYQMPEGVTPGGGHRALGVRLPSLAGFPHRLLASTAARFRLRVYVRRRGFGGATHFLSESTQRIRARRAGRRERRARVGTNG